VASKDTSRDNHLKTFTKW